MAKKRMTAKRKVAYHERAMKAAATRKKNKENGIISSIVIEKRFSELENKITLLIGRLEKERVKQNFEVINNIAEPELRVEHPQPKENPSLFGEMDKMINYTDAVAQSLVTFRENVAQYTVGITEAYDRMCKINEFLNRSK